MFREDWLYYWVLSLDVINIWWGIIRMLGFIVMGDVALRLLRTVLLSQFGLLPLVGAASPLAGGDKLTEEDDRYKRQQNRRALRTFKVY